MGQLEIVGMGHLCQDIVCEVSGFPQRSKSNHALRARISAGGAASQAMVTYSRLGGRAGFAGSLGEDKIGRELIHGLEREGVDTSFLRLRKEMESGFSVVLTEHGTGERTFVVHKPPYVPQTFGEDFRRYLSVARYLHLDGTNMEEHLAAAQLAAELGTRVSLDGCSMRQDRDKTRRLIKLTDILIMNEQFPLWLTGVSSLTGALQKIEDMGPRIVMMTLGNRGSVALQDGKMVRCGIYPVQVVDTTGAGDVFHGAFLFAWLRKMPLERAMRFASAASAINCTYLGGREGIPSFAEVEAFMESHEISNF